MSRTVTLEAAPATTLSVEKKTPTIRQIRNAIPEHCFKPTAWKSSAHAIFDCSVAALIAFAAYKTIPLVEYWPARWALWALYGYIEGLVFTGIWIVAHECGHGGLYTSNWANDIVGYTLHTSLLVPYFPWKYTHARHHRYTGHMEKDTAFVPHRAGEKSIGSKIAEVIGHAEDAPLYMFGGLVMHQLLGWQAYLLFYVSAGARSTPKALEGSSWAGSHFDPMANLWTPSQRPFVFLSTVGLGAVMFALYQLSGVIGVANTFLLYGLPYLWVNNWLVAITYLHHTHPDSHHYEASRWTFLDGALTTVDRPFGFIGRKVFHGIIDFHVVHHLFPSMPFYHAEEATKAMRPVLGDYYRRDDTPFWIALWKTFSSCQAVQPKEGEEGVLEWETKKTHVKSA
ncbi:uncharacterized protein MYCGRDRAFT_101437 [Zymoseptoria tritici IPO323]|uniref:Fatty acid desaturase domain-containing protein n=1 Tax=Zymoseptoria tritici (strain CBS 115943 / IPO323) TaxID=336722 RepID=F9XL58_ZYMTI|nr:uncharacterized protein MYCGRDRAFT_101437 [Zymoseptoria tritici IPO323]EGP84094.1 hypothetical protein MYCGRDRAFT_101437 [Zymoseptoria tritici IPO323]